MSTTEKTTVDDDAPSAQSPISTADDSSNTTSSRHTDRNVERAERTLAENFGDMAVVGGSSSSGPGSTPLHRYATTTASNTNTVEGRMDNSSNNNNRSEDVMTAPDQTTLSTSAASLSDDRDSSNNNNNNTNTTKSNNAPSSAIPSFTSDSPYLQSYIDREMRSLAVLTETLRDISARARTFGKCGALMAEATRRLSGACRLNTPTSGAKNNSGSSAEVGGGEEGSVEYEEQMRVMKERKESVGEEMTNVLSVLGDILDEVADAQVSMCQSLEASLSLSLEAFAGVEMNEATRLRSECDVMSDNAESSFSKYMHGRHSERANVMGVADSGIGNTGISMDLADQQNLAASWNKLSDHVGSQLKHWSRSTSNESNGTNSSGEGNESTVKGGMTGKLGMMRANKGKEVEKDPALATAEAAANLMHNLEQMRLAQANAELKRFQLLRRLDFIKTRRNFELGESALASLNGVRAYFHHCSDMIDGLTPKLSRLQDKQVHWRGKHDAQQAPWESKQKALTNAIGEVGASAANAGAVADAISRGEVEGLDAILSQPLSLEEIEKTVKLWDLPRQLNIVSLYQRKPTSGVIVEGWLYKKSSNRLSLNAWTRRWFILDKNGVYYLNGGSNDKGGNNAQGQTDFMERVKVCDILLCTVREINSKAKGNPNLRWCFEIISPNSKSYMLQACGPNDFKMWVGGIRSCIGKIALLITCVTTSRLAISCLTQHCCSSYFRTTTYSWQDSTR